MRTLIILALVGIALAAGTAGSLDSNFDGDGLVLTPPNGEDSTHATFWSVAVQADGKVVAAGFEQGEQAPFFVVARHDAYGSLDTSFGTDGFVKPFGDDNSASGDARSVVLYEDGTGRILVLGSTTVDQTITKGRNKGVTTRVSRLALVRLAADGSLDTSFGDGGVALVDVGGFGWALALQADGKIVAVAKRSVKNSGKGKASKGSNGALALVRFDADGVLDPDFGDGGIVLDNPSEDDERPNDVVIQSDGKIVVGGNYPEWHNGEPAEGGSRAFLRRYEINGDLDTTFGDAGLTRSVYGRGPIAIDDSDRILVVGAFKNVDGTRDLIVERYNANGMLDTSFGNSTPPDGRYATGLPGELRSVFLLPDDGALDSNGSSLFGRIVACGETFGAPQDGFVVRLNPNGTADSSFGVSGISVLTVDISRFWDCAYDPVSKGYVICGAKIGVRTIPAPDPEKDDPIPISDFFLARYCK